MVRLRMLVGAVLCGLALPSQALDLFEVYQQALDNDSQFRAARAQYVANLEKYPQARAGLLPAVNLTGNSTYAKTQAMLPAERQFGANTNSYQLQLTQPLFRWQNWMTYQQGSLQTGLAEAQLRTARNDVATRAAQSYFDVLLAEDVLRSVQSLKTASNEQLQSAKKSFEVGTVTVTDVNEAQSKYDLAAAQAIAAESDLTVKRQALQLLLGKPVASLARLRDKMEIVAPQPANLDDWAQAAEANNSAVAAGNLVLEIAKREVEKSRAGHLPTVDLVAGHSNSHVGNSAAGSQSMSRNNSIGLQLSLPIYAGGATQSKVRENLALQDKAEADLETQRRTAAQAARQAYVGVVSGIAQVRGYEAAVRSSQSAVDSNKLGYQVGVRVNIDVLNAQSTLADAQQKLAKARYDALMSQLKLKAASSQIEVEDVQTINRLLDLPSTANPDATKR